MGIFVLGQYEPFSGSPKVVQRTDIVLKGQTPFEVASHVASIHGYKLIKYKVIKMSEKQYRRKHGFSGD